MTDTNKSFFVINVNWKASIYFDMYSWDYIQCLLQDSRG